MVGIDLGATMDSRLLADHIFNLSTFATNLLFMAIAASTDYAIFMLGRYHESRYAGEDRNGLLHDVSRGRPRICLV